MVLLVLAGIWAAVIVVPLVRARTEGTLGDSIGSFRRHLSILERAAPMTVAPANRLRMPGTASSIPPYRPHVASGSRGYSMPVSANRRRQAQRRRRDVLLALMAAIVGSALLAMIPGLGIMWTVNFIVDVTFALYLVLLVRMRNVAAEREMKLTFLPNVIPSAARFTKSPYGDAQPVAIGLAELARRAN